MKRINKSKNPTTQQMLNMATNLREKFKDCVTVDIVAWAFFPSNRDEIKYKIYIADVHYKTYKTWPDTLNDYFKLMED